MYIGIDLGGTNIAAALVDGGGRITKRAGLPTNAKGGASVITAGLMHVCEELTEGMAEAPLSIGIGVPGIVNDDTGEVIFTPNLPLGGINITREIQEKYGRRIRLGNDANCAALGEVVAGGARGAQNVVFITLGTGVGGGIVLNGSLHTGFNGAAGELGHMVIVAGGRSCGCGRKGCWETYASASGLIRTAIEHMGTHDDSLLWERCGGVAEKITGKAIFDAFRAGDETARLTVDLYIKHLAAGIISIINILQPEMFCVGGGISHAWDCLESPLQAAVNAEVITRFSASTPQTKIVRAQLGNDAGIIGAAALGF